MNFEKWLNSKIKFYDKTVAGTLEQGWDACKNEILKILKDENNRAWFDTQAGAHEAIMINVIEKIEKL